MVDGVYQVEVLLWQLMVGIDKLDHQVLLHSIEDAGPQVVEAYQPTLIMGIVAVAVAHRGIIQQYYKILHHMP